MIPTCTTPTCSRIKTLTNNAVATLATRPRCNRCNNRHARSRRTTARLARASWRPKWPRVYRWMIKITDEYFMNCFLIRKYRHPFCNTCTALFPRRYLYITMLPRHQRCNVNATMPFCHCNIASYTESRIKTWVLPNCHSDFDRSSVLKSRCCIV